MNQVTSKDSKYVGHTSDGLLVRIDLMQIREGEDGFVEEVVQTYSLEEFKEI